LSLALAERCSDPLLERISVVSVVPAPDSSRLLVTVTVDSDDEIVEADEVIESMKRIRPELRREIAQEISRKKTPELVFDLAPRLDPRAAGL
jgi:ribosome-binding factor A